MMRKFIATLAFVLVIVAAAVAATVQMGALQLKGSSSGSITLQATAVAGSNTQTLQAGTGTVPLTNLPQVWSAQQSDSITTLSISTATFTPDGSNNDYSITLVHASCPCTLANPSSTPVAGTKGVIYITQSGTGSDTIGTWGSDYMTAGGTSAITLSTAAGAIDVLSYAVKDSTHIVLSAPFLNVAH